MGKFYKFFIVFYLLIFVFTSVSAQNLDLIVQDYHGEEITNLCFSPNSKFLASASKDKTIKIWDVRTGLLYNSIGGFLFGVNSIEFSEDGKYLISNGDIMDKKLWDIHSGKEIDFYKKNFQFKTYVRALAIDTVSNQIIVAFKSGNLQSWNYKTETLNYEIPIDQNERIEIGFLPKSEEFYVLSSSGINFYSKTKGNMKRKIPNTLNSTKKFSLNSKQSVYGFGSSDGQIKVFPFGTSTIKQNTFIGLKNEVSDLFFSKTGKYVIASYGLNNYYIWDLVTNKRILEGIRIFDLDFSDNDSLILCSSKQLGFFYYNIFSDKKTAIPNIKADFNSKVSINTFFNLLVLVDDANQLIFYDFLESNLVRKRDFRIDIPASSALVNNNLYLLNPNGALFKFNFQELKGVEFCKDSEHSINGIFDFNNQIFTTTSNSITCNTDLIIKSVSDKADKIKKLNKGLLLYENGDIKYQSTEQLEMIYHYSGNSIIDFDYDEENQVLGIIDQKSIVFIDVKRQTILKKIPQPQNVYIFIKFINNKNEVLLLDDIKVLKKINYENKKNLFTLRDPSGLTTFSMDDAQKNFIEYDYDNKIAYFMGEEFKILAVDIETGEILRILKGHNGLISNIQIDPNHSFLISNSWDGSTKVWNLNSGDLVATLIFSGNNWIVFTPDNFYSFNKNGHGLVGFKLDDKITTFESFDLTYNRPDILLTRFKANKEITDIYKIAHNKRIHKMNLDSNEKLDHKKLPRITLINSGNIPLNAKQELIELNLSAYDSFYLIKQVTISVNGCQVSSFNPNAKSFIKKLQIKLNNGKNIIRIQAINSKGLSSLPELINVNYKSKEITKPNLYLFIVGVSEYADKTNNLKYAVKDGNDLIETFSKQKDKYNKIIIDTLYNKNANKLNFIKQSKKFNSVGINDVIVFSFSGHGLLDDNFDFYFASYDVDFNSPQKNGISYDLIESILKSSPARKKLLLVDACHSGEVEKEIQAKFIPKKVNKDSVKLANTKGLKILDNEPLGLDPFHLMQQIFVSTSFNSGIVSITASTGNSFALESDLWKNGAFTHCLLQLLNSNEGSILISEFKDKLEKSVIELTKGRQQPTSRSENLEYDWLIWQ